MIITIDPATVCGWAVGAVGAQPPLLSWGTRDFRRAESNGEVIAIFRAWFNNLCYTHKPFLCVFESPFIPIPRANAKYKPSASPPMNPLVLRRLLGMTGAIEAVCYELRITCRESTSQQFTKHLTGKGRFAGGRDEKKAQVIKACRGLGLDVENDDEGDAVALWLFAEGILDPRASEYRRRLAADRNRAITGDGPLFPAIIENASQGPSCEALINSNIGTDHGADCT